MNPKLKEATIMLLEKRKERATETQKLKIQEAIDKIKNMEEN